MSRTPPPLCARRKRQQYVVGGRHARTAVKTTPRGHIRGRGFDDVAINLCGPWREMSNRRKEQSRAMSLARVLVRLARKQVRASILQTAFETMCRWCAARRAAVAGQRISSMSTQIAHLKKTLAAEAALRKAAEEIRDNLQTQCAQHMALQREQREKLDDTIRCKEETERLCQTAVEENSELQHMFDTLEAKAERLQRSLAKARSENDILARAKALKDKHIVLLVKEKARLHDKYVRAAVQVRQPKVPLRERNRCRRKSSGHAN